MYDHKSSSQTQSRQRQLHLLRQGRTQQTRAQSSFGHYSSPLRKKCQLATSLLFLLFLLLQPKVAVCQQQQQKQNEHEHQQRQVEETTSNINKKDNSYFPPRLGDFVTFSTEPFTPNVTHRQNVCDRYDAFRNGKLGLRNALQGLTLHPIIYNDAYFNYDHETGIDDEDPGLVGTLLDELANRAGFTWRNSFGILEAPQNETFNNVTWTYTDLLVWSVETYDISIWWWDESVERLERGVSYTEPWYNGSVILIHHDDTAHLHDESSLNLFNWLLPFERDVWLLVVATIIVSGLIHQLLEYLDDEQNERSLWQWFSDSFYLSWLNITQNYEYAPNTLSGRIFGISMGVWALVMTATYTANLASLLVEQNTDPPIFIENIDQAVALGIPICTWGNTNPDIYIKERYESAIRIPKATESEAYIALQRGECGLVAGYKGTWLEYQNDRRYNPDCRLKWVGQTVEIFDSGFATKADSGYLCTSLIRDVFNLHLKEMIQDQVLEKAWETHRSKSLGSNAISCTSSSTDGGDDGDEQDDNNSRFLRTQQNSSPASVVHDHPHDFHHESKRNAPPSTSTNTKNRKLKGTGGNAASTNDGSSSSNGAPPLEGMRLTIHQTAGVFLFHFALMGIAVIVGLIGRYLRIQEEEKVVAEAIKKVEEENLNGDGDTLDTSERSTRLAAAAAMARSQLLDRRKVSFRSHGPIIGAPPPVNTYIRNNYHHPYDTNKSFIGASHSSIARYESVRHINNYTNNAAYLNHPWSEQVGKRSSYPYTFNGGGGGHAPGVSSPKNDASFSNQSLPSITSGELYPLSEKVRKRNSDPYTYNGGGAGHAPPISSPTSSCRNDCTHQNLDESPSMVLLRTLVCKLDKSVSATKSEIGDFHKELQEVKSHTSLMMSMIQEIYLNTPFTTDSSSTTATAALDTDDKAVSCKTKKKKTRTRARPYKEG